MKVREAGRTVPVAVTIAVGVNGEVLGMAVARGLRAIWQRCRVRFMRATPPPMRARHSAAWSLPDRSRFAPRRRSAPPQGATARQLDGRSRGRMRSVPPKRTASKVDGLYTPIVSTTPTILWPALSSPSRLVGDGGFPPTAPRRRRFGSRRLRRLGGVEAGAGDAPGLTRLTPSG